MTIKPSIFYAFLHGVILFSVTLLVGCNDLEDTYTLTFSPKYQNKPLNCLSSFNHQGKTWQYSQLQFFISEIELKSTNGQWQTWPLAENKYQSNEVALLGEYCQANKVMNQLTPGNWQLSFQQAIDAANVSQLRFTLGVPFSLNHQNPLLQASPLNVPSMFWVWQTGHKFFRLEMKEIRELEPKNNWQFHLGSTGCKAPSPLRAPKKPCENANQTRITLDVKVNSEVQKLQNIDVNLAGLFSELIITRENSCQSESYNKSCLALFKNIGLLESQSQGLFKFTRTTPAKSLSN